MKNIIYFLLLVTFYGYSQQKDVTVYSLENKGNPEIYAKNHSDVRQKVTVQLKTKGFKKHEHEVVKNVPAKDSLLMITLIPVSNKSDMQIAFGSSPNLSKLEKEAKSKKLSTKFYKKGDNLNKGIVIFHKNNCPRCNKSTNYLLDNNIDFTWVQLPSNQEIVTNTVPKELMDNQYMFKNKLKEEKINGGLTTPVFMVNGKITHSHKDLDKFLSKL